MSVLIRLDRHLICAWLLCSCPVFAQNSPSKTLGDLITQSKKQQEQSLGLRTDSKTTPSASQKKDADAKSAAAKLAAQKPPVLWSLTGVNYQLVAELIYKESVHVLHLHDGERKVGPWVIERYGVNGLHLVLADDPKKTLFLPAPAAGAPLERYVSALPLTTSQPPPAATAPGPAKGGNTLVAQNPNEILPVGLLNNFDTRPPSTDFFNTLNAPPNPANVRP